MTVFLYSIDGMASTFWLPRVKTAAGGLNEQGGIAPPLKMFQRCSADRVLLPGFHLLHGCAQIGRWRAALTFGRPEFRLGRKFRFDICTRLHLH